MRITIVRVFTAIVACANMAVSGASAQSYPVKPIRIVVGNAAGGTADTTARMVAQKISKPLGQPVVVENRPGASGTIAAERVGKSPADGYTMLMMAGGDTVQSALRANLPYSLERDFTPISLIAVAPQLLVVHPSVPVQSVKALIALARARPGKLTYGSAGVGSSAHLIMELFNSMAKLSAVHVPYKGGAESVIATATGQVDMSFVSITAALPLMKAHRVKALAVSTAKRASSVPAIPTLSESGLSGYDRFGWNGLIAPAGVPKEIITRLNTLIVDAVNSTDVKESFNNLGLEPRPNTPEEFAAFIRREVAQNARLVKAAGVKAE